MLYFAGVELAAGVLEAVPAALPDEESDDALLDLAGAALSPEPVFEVPLLSLELLADDPPSDESLFALLLEPYPSAYQPPPLNCTAGAEINCSNVPEQIGQTVSGASENFCRFSSFRPQVLH